jgi:hypothetical protein
LRALNPCELEIDLFCRGLRIDPSCALEQDARLMSRTRAGLGSGLEIVLPGPLKEIWVNVPIEEEFVASSPYTLSKRDGNYLLHDTRCDATHAVRIPPEPGWYSRQTSHGTPMCRIGVLQGTYLGIYISNSCLFWYTNPVSNCRFCTTGLNVGVNEMVNKPVQEVVEVACAARDESGVTFVHLNSGFHAGRDLDIAAPYVKALKEQVGTLVGVQLTPTEDLWKYDRLIDLGADHFSFCYECHNPEHFARVCPGKERWIGQQTFFRAMEYVAHRLPRGAVSGEVIAGVEPVEDTCRAIDYITSLGAFPTVCVFRPTLGSDMENEPPPRYESMLEVFHHLYNACRRRWIPVELAPNIEVSLIVQPGDTFYLAPRGLGSWTYRQWIRLLRALSTPYWLWKLRPRPVRADAQLEPPAESSGGGESATKNGAPVS